MNLEEILFVSKIQKKIETKTGDLKTKDQPLEIINGEYIFYGSGI